MADGRQEKLIINKEMWYGYRLSPSRISDVSNGKHSRRSGDTTTHFSGKTQVTEKPSRPLTHSNSHHPRSKSASVQKLLARQGKDEDPVTIPRDAVSPETPDIRNESPSLSDLVKQVFSSIDDMSVLHDDLLRQTSPDIENTSVSHLDFLRQASPEVGKTSTSHHDLLRHLSPDAENTWVSHRHLLRQASPEVEKTSISHHDLLRHLSPEVESTSDSHRHLLRQASPDAGDTSPLLGDLLKQSSPEGTNVRNTSVLFSDFLKEAAPNKRASYVTTFEENEFPRIHADEKGSRKEGVVLSLRRRSVSDSRGVNASPLTDSRTTRADVKTSRRYSLTKTPVPPSVRRNSEWDNNHRVNYIGPNNQNMEIESKSRNLKTSRKSSKYARGSNNTTTMAKETQSNKGASRLSRKSNRFLSKLGIRSRRSSFFYHGDILDENLLISVAKLDSTLIRLFSHTRDSKVEKDDQDPSTALMPYMNYAQSDLINMDSVFWRVYPMESAHKETLEQEMAYIETNIRPQDIMTRLYQDEVLTHMDYNQLTRTEGQGNRAVNRLIVKTLQRRGEKAYPAFMNALKEHEYIQVCERLENTERMIRQGMQMDKLESQCTREMGKRRISRSTLGMALGHGGQNVHQANETFASPINLVSRINLISSGSPESAMEKRTSGPVSNLPPSSVLPASCEDPVEIHDQPIIDSKQLGTFLTNLKAELEALHEEVTALRSARSPSLDTGRNWHSEKLASESDLPETDTDIANTVVPLNNQQDHDVYQYGMSAERHSENLTSRPASQESPNEFEDDTTVLTDSVGGWEMQEDGPGPRTQKSSSCILL